MAKYSQTYTIAFAAGGTSITDCPGKGIGPGYVRIENLDAANAVWLALVSAQVPVVEANNTVRIPPGGSYRTNILSDMRLIAVTANVKVLLDAS